MQKHEQKQCPRCKENFECKTGSIELCQCQSVKLTEQHLEYIQSRYDDCLCASCLIELRREYNIGLFEEKINTLLIR